jgi:hypothetical protein
VREAKKLLVFRESLRLFLRSSIRRKRARRDRAAERERMSFLRREKAVNFATFLLTAILLLATAGNVSAGEFNFDTTPLGFSSTLTVTDGTQTLVVTSESGAFVGVQNSGVPLLGLRSVIGSLVAPLQFGRHDSLRFTFSIPVTSITFAFGDAGGDDDASVVIQAFDSNQVLLGTLGTDYPANFNLGKTLSGNFPTGAKHFTLRSGLGTFNPNSIFWEVPSYATAQFKITIVPANGAVESSSTITSLAPAATVALVARVVDQNGQLVPNVNVRLEATAVANSGGHDHHDANRPNGSLGGSGGTPNVVTGNTGTTGFVFGFTAAEISGSHEIAATCTDCTPDGPNTVRVMVSGLQELGPGADYDLVGDTTPHPRNHYGTASLIASLRILAQAYAQAFPGNRLAYNDMSLEFGGLFDIRADWRPPHRSHRLGTDVDLRLVPPGQRQALRHLIRQSGIGTILVENNPPHWHLRQ